MVFFHLKGKTSLLGLLLMKGDKEAEITVMLLLYEVCRKYYEVQGSYVEITYLDFKENFHCRGMLLELCISIWKLREKGRSR